jgi:hypothetical protein
MTVAPTGPARREGVLVGECESVMGRQDRIAQLLPVARVWSLKARKVAIGLVASGLLPTRAGGGVGDPGVDRGEEIRRRAAAW